MVDFDADWLVELLLPVTHNDGSPVDQDVMSTIRQELVDRFGELTAFTRSPAEGVWTSAAGDSRDDIVVLEVMARGLDRPWWGAWLPQPDSKLREAHRLRAGLRRC